MFSRGGWGASARAMNVLEYWGRECRARGDLGEVVFFLSPSHDAPRDLFSPAFCFSFSKPLWRKERVVSTTPHI